VPAGDPWESGVGFPVPDNTVVWFSEETARTARTGVTRLLDSGVVHPAFFNGG